MLDTPCDDSVLGELAPAGASRGAPGPAGRGSGRGSRSAQRLAAEHALTDALSQAGDLAQAAPRIAQLVCEALGWTCGACWIESPRRDALVRAGSWAGGDALAEAFVQAVPAVGPLDEAAGVLRRVWARGHPVWIRDVVHEPGYRRADAARRAGLHSAFAFPITCGAQVLGVVEIYSGRIEELDASWLECMRYVGSQIGQFHVRALAQAQLRESEKRHADTIELAAIGIAHVGEGGRLLHANRWLCELLGYRREELLGLTVRQISHPDDIAVTDGVRARLHGGEIASFQAEKRYLRRDGTPVWVQLTISAQRDAQGRPLHDIAIIQDITARKQAEAALHLSEQRFRNMVELSSDWYWELDAALRFTTFGGRDTGRRHARLLLGRLAWEIPGAEGGEGWPEFRARLERREPFRDFEYAFVDRSGSRCTVSVSGEPLFDAGGGFAGYRGVSRDISERKRAEERVQYLATHDSLTGLPNRAMFSELLNHLIQSSRREGRRFAVLFIDLDRFKLINDSLGHEAGDTLLRTVAQRLKDGLRSSDLVARLGGDEFVMIAQDLPGPEQAARVARRLLAEVIRPVDLSGQECRVTASVGISLYPDDAQDEAALMTHADVAMYHAKEEGKNNFQFYDSRLEKHTLERLALEAGLRHAIERGELSLHYQAKLELADGSIGGVEALLRWTSPELGSISPAQFIPLAEETGLILPIGRWVLRSACVQSMAWQHAGLPPVRVAVNLSPRQLADPGLVDEVRTILAETGLAPDLLELEVTETSVMHNVERALEVLSALKAMGVLLAIDDFGTGYSSLAQLKRFPIDTLKVDRSFIRELPMDAEDKAITEVIIAMGKTLCLKVVAEGVETREQQEFLRERACDQLQGYYFSKPLPAAEFAALLRSHRAVAG
ncbi:MAG: EAL domain-containing protein [Burkholderiales bacterium]|nr:EAL domain-containing protein [Burkholderiales bacterium]